MTDEDYAPQQSYGTRDDQVDIERLRLSMLSEARDPKACALLTQVGIAEGMHCLEIGAGAGNLARSRQPQQLRWPQQRYREIEASSLGKCGEVWRLRAGCKDV